MLIIGLELYPSLYVIRTSNAGSHLFGRIDIASENSLLYAGVTFLELSISCKRIIVLVIYINM